MSITAVVAWRPATIGQQNNEEGYIIRGTSDPAAAKVALENKAPDYCPSVIVWSALTTYGQGQLSATGDLFYKSLHEDNLDHEPPDAAWWVVVSVTRRPLNHCTIDRYLSDSAGGYFVGTAYYSSSSEPEQETGDVVYSFEVGGGSYHITQSRFTVQKYARKNETATDHHGAINVQNKIPAGVDIPQLGNAFRSRHTYYPANADVTGTYKGKLFAAALTVNNASFKGFDAGECIFLGASGGPRGDGSDWEIGLDFAAVPNRSSFSVPYAEAWDSGTTYSKSGLCNNAGGTAQYLSLQDANINHAPPNVTWWKDVSKFAVFGIDKKGWEYMWAEYKPGEGDDGLTQLIAGIYVENVFEYTNFSDLGIGT